MKVKSVFSWVDSMSSSALNTIPGGKIVYEDEINMENLYFTSFQMYSKKSCLRNFACKDSSTRRSDLLVGEDTEY